MPQRHCTTSSIASYIPLLNWLVWCTIPCQISPWSTYTVAMWGEKLWYSPHLQVWTAPVSPVPSAFPNRGPIQHERVHPWCTVPSQISPWSVNTAAHTGPKQQIWPFLQLLLGSCIQWWPNSAFKSIPSVYAYKKNSMLFGSLNHPWRAKKQFCWFFQLQHNVVVPHSGTKTKLNPGVQV